MKSGHVWISDPTVFLSPDLSGINMPFVLRQLFLNFQTATVLRRTYTPPPLGPYATKHQINESVFADNKYRRYDVEVEDDEAKTMEAPIKIIILKNMEGKIWLLAKLSTAVLY